MRRFTMSLPSAAIVGALAAALTGLTGIGAGTASAAQADTTGDRPEVSRLSGPSRYETAAAIAEHTQWPTSIYPSDGWHNRHRIVVVRGDRPLDAVARGADAPVVLPIPPRGPIPPAVQRVLRRHAPEQVTVVGDARALPDAQVKALLGKIPFVRDTRSVLTASADSGQAYRGSDDSWAAVEASYVVSPRVVGEAAAAVQLRPMPVVVLPDSGPADARPGSTAVELIWQGPFTRVGSVRAERVATFYQASMRGSTSPLAPSRIDARARLAGADRYETAALIARRAYPEGARTVYLADWRGIDAAFGVGLDGPILLVPPGDVPPASVRDALAMLRPTRVVALGDTSVVTEGMLAAAAAATPERDQARAVATAGACVAEVDGTIKCVEPDRGRLPGGSTGPKRWPLVSVGVAPDPVAEMTASLGDVCARTQAGAVVCTTLFRDEAGERRTGLVTPPGLERGVSAIRVTSKAVFAVTREGRLVRAPRAGRAWGAARPVPEAGDDVRKVASDDSMTCVLTGDAAVRCWGVWSELPRSVAGNEPSPWPTHGPTLVPDLPSGITDIDLHFNGLRVRTTDGRVHLMKADGLTHPAREAASDAPFRVREGSRLQGCVPTLDDPARLRCIPDYPAAREYPSRTAAGPIAAVVAGPSADGELVVLADGRVQWVSELPTTSTTAPPRFVLGFGG